MADHEISRYPEVLRYPAGEALKSYEYRLRERARTDYHAACQIWAALAATGATKRQRPPDLPAIIKE